MSGTVCRPTGPLEGPGRRCPPSGPGPGPCPCQNPDKTRTIMYRSVRRRLLRTLQPYAPGHSFGQATAVLLLPATYTAAEPRWSPGPGFVELATASKWGRRTPDGRLLAVVRSTDRDT